MRGEIRLLGPVEVIGPLGPATLHGARQRAVLGALALNAGTTVPRERLIDVLWDENPPRTAVRSLRSHVSRVRQSLTECGLRGVLRTSEPGYLLDVASNLVDAHVFEHAVTAAGDGTTGGLRAALALWRGDALEDAGLTGWGVAAIDRLHEMRLCAWEYLWEAELRHGRHEAATSELARLLVAHPTRERLVGLYMLALYRCGRQVDALDAYRRLRERLADELGVDPGPELSLLYTDILRHSATLAAQDTELGGTTPAQLPARAGHFTGREAELAELDGLLDDADRSIAVISGPGGMGKTALAVQWAHRIVGRFPGGQLFLDLHGHDPDRALPVEDALTHLLLGLGVPDGRVPPSMTEKTGLYRSLLHQRPVLIVLDNCAASAELAELVPGAATSLLLVTSRNVLAPLMVRHTVCAVRLDALDPAESLTLLTSVLGAARVDAERLPAARLARLCGGMPLALRIAAAKLMVRPDRPIRALADELEATDPLDSLAVEGDSRTVRTVLASAYLAMSKPAARAFRLLGSHPGPSFCIHLAAAVCGVPLARARPWVDELAAAHLITGAGEERYRFHDLIRLFANQCCVREETPDTRAGAVGRVVDWYLTLAEAANRVLDRAPDRVRPAPRYPAELPRLDDWRTALAFLDAERHNMVPIVRYADEQGQHTAAWQLTSALTSFFDARGHWTERIEMCRVGVAAAGVLGDPAAEGEMLRSLGTAYRLTRRMTEALACYPRALALMRLAGDVRGEAAVHNNIGGASVELRRFDDAIVAYHRALTLHDAAGNRWGTAVVQRNLGYTYVRMGRPDLSVDPLRSALANARASNDPRLEAATLDSIGEAWLHQGDVGAALDHFRRALELGRRVGDRRFEMETLNNIGIALLEQGDPAAALESLRQALAASCELADPHGESLARDNIGRARLALGDLEGAREELRLALAIRERVPDSYAEARVRRNLADLEERSGRPGAAALHRERATRLGGTARV